ncbi:MAG: citrate transporter [Lachnospiraceae bacterium]|nr:citrate transporter [Lachnospiraceae bacterium]
MDILKKYIFEQINFETLAILFSLMLVVAGFTKLGYIDMLAEKIIDNAKNRRSLILLMVMACFFISMLVTNDVALILMVPFAIGVLSKSGKSDCLIFVVVMQTIAANLGSMLTPIGNPQNVYLYQYYEMNLQQFFGAVFPYALASFVLIFIIVIVQKGGSETVEISDGEKTDFVFKPLKTTVYTVCLVLCVLSVLNVVNIFITLAVVTILVLACDYKLIKEVNYGLLVKFIFLFILVGNLAGIPVIKDNLSSITQGNEFACGVIFSQFLSNVPAAIMLSRFTVNGTALLEGVNVGGLGTLIASMASMISYEFYGKVTGADRKKYVKYFTIYNVIFLIVMLLVRLVIVKR